MMTSNQLAFEAMSITSTRTAVIQREFSTVDFFDYEQNCKLQRINFDNKNASGLSTGFDRKISLNDNTNTAIIRILS